MKILVVTLSNLGDVVLTLPVFQTLIQNFPEAKIDVVVGERAAEVFQQDPRIERIIPYNRRIGWREKWRLLSSIRDERYDLIIDLRKSFLGLFGGAKARNFYLDFSGKTVHQAVKHIGSLENFVSELEMNESFLKPDTRLIPAALKRRVVVAPGSKSDIKKWPAEYFAQVLDQLSGSGDCEIVFIGDLKDADDVKKIKGLMTHESLDLAGRTSFKELCAWIKTAELVITNDSAPLHIADSLKVPVLAIFGPTDPRKYGPRFSQSLVARKTLFCSPCEKPQCRYHHECLRELGPEEVYQKALQILSDEFQPRNLKVLVVRLDRVGDVILSLPAVAAIRERFPNAMISVMVRPYTQALIEGHPLVDETIPYFYEKGGRHRGLGNLRFIREIAKRRFDIAFILHPSLRSNLVPFLAGIPYRIGFRSHAPFFLTKSVVDRRAEGLKHESDYTLDIVRAFGIRSLPEKKMSLPVSPEEARKVSGILEQTPWGGNEGIVAIHAGASCPSKRWPKERFLELAKRIMKEMPYRVAIVGGKEEVELGAYFRKEGGPRLLDLTGRLDLKELAAFFKRCEALITNDSGPVHVAAAVGTRTLCIFGRNQAGLSPVRWKALGKNHEVIQKDVGCVVCLAHRCTIDFECLKAVEVEEVFSRLEKMLPKKTAGVV